MRSAFLLALAILSTKVMCAAQAGLTAPPEIIFYNGVIYTGEGFAQDKPQTVQSIAIGGGRVIAIGTNEEIKRLAGSKTTLRDLSSANSQSFVFPGLHDAHTHL